MVVEINEIVNEMVSLLESLDFLAVDTFCFEDREEILGHGVIRAIAHKIQSFMRKLQYCPPLVSSFFFHPTLSCLHMQK